MKRIRWWMFILASTVFPTAGFSNDAWFETLRTERVESDPAIVWKQFGPGMSGNNYRIYWHPTDPDVVFLGPNMGNAYRSTDRGTTYEGILDYDGQGHSFDKRGPSEINSPDFSRQNPDLGFCSREAESHLYKTIDRGKSWMLLEELDSVWKGLVPNTIAVDPGNDQVWYVGSGNANDLNKFYFTAAQPHGVGANGQVAKIWKTENQGVSWNDITPTGLNSGAQIIRILVHPSNSNVVFAATTYGFYKSTDAGANWTAKIASGMDNDIVRSFDMHYDEENDQVTLFALDLVRWAADGTTVRNDGGGLFRSDDEGESWVNINGDLGIDISALAGLYEFRNGYFLTLNKWFGINNASTLYPDYPSHLLHSYSLVRVDPNDVNKIFLLNDYKHFGAWRTFRGGMLWRTDDGGDNWIATLRNGTAWEGVHKNYWEGRGNPTHYNLELRGQKKWEIRDAYERKAGAALEFNSDSSVILFQWAKTLCMSFDGGDTWIENDEIEATPGTENWVASGNSNLPGHGFRQDPRFPEKLFLPCGENDFWVTTDDGDNVRSGAQAAHRMQLGSHEYSCSDIAFHPNDTDVIYSLQFRQASAGKLRRSTDGGQTFADIGTALPWPEGESTNDSIDQLCLTIDPDDPDNMYFCIPADAAVHGFTWDPKLGPKGIRKSSDGGFNWDWANNGLPTSLDVPCVRLDPNDSSKLYACVYGNGGGLYVSTDRAETWTKHPTLPSNIYSVSDIHFSNDGKMYVSCGHHSDDDWRNGGVWVSEDNGTSWTQIFKTNWARMTKTAVYDPDVVLVQMNSKGTLPIMNPGTYLSKDGGASWSKINTGNPQSDRVNDIAIDQVQRDVYYISTQGCGWLRADLIDLSNEAPKFKDDFGELPSSVPGEQYAGSLGEAASDANEDSITYSLIFGPAWLSVAPDGSISASPPADAIGSYKFQVQADDGKGLSVREIFNLQVSVDPISYYESWISGYADLGDETGMEDDPDKDGLLNFCEYALGGDPSRSNPMERYMPTLKYTAGNLECVYHRRKDAQDRGLDYQLETTTDIGSGNWIQDGSLMSEVTLRNSEFEMVAHQVQIDGNHKMIRLRMRLEE